MSVKEIPCYTITCDWLGCDADVCSDHTDYSGWGDVEHVDETLDDSDWWRDRDGERHYCYRHFAAWASDITDGDPAPEPPYLLIHDGDTANLDDDGKVTLIPAEVTP